MRPGYASDSEVVHSRLNLSKVVRRPHQRDFVANFDHLSAHETYTPLEPFVGKRIALPRPTPIHPGTSRNDALILDMLKSDKLKEYYISHQKRNNNTGVSMHHYAHPQGGIASNYPGGVALETPPADTNQDEYLSKRLRYIFNKHRQMQANEGLRLKLPQQRNDDFDDVRSCVSMRTSYSRPNETKHMRHHFNERLHSDTTVSAK